MADVRQLLRDLPVFAGELPAFDPLETPDDPVELFTAWLLGAIRAQVPEPHAMTVSTAGADGNPSARTLILKDIDADGWRFAAHRDSTKGRELTDRPYAALTFYWQPLARQVRVRGPVVRESAEHAAADFLARSPGARAEALLGRQSRPLGDLAERDAAVAESAARLAREPGLVAPGWTLHTVRAESVEFWQGDKDRKHTRLAYQRAGGAWRKELLWP
ncbi:pyridoxal 5'-phosphate synthase [Streptomyces sp. NPDC048516]|uniref:pyridoxine/pyridoxamine 5'-phosphate oxidase n=1 Tax=Streptomyces sp. NPDC048516 TaxID=3365565 RepID=UPI0037220110